MSYDLIPKPDQFIRDVQRGLDAGGGLPKNVPIVKALIIIAILGALVKAIMGW